MRVGALKKVATHSLEEQTGGEDGLSLSRKVELSSWNITGIIIYLAK